MWISSLFLLVVLIVAVQGVQKKIIRENEKWSQFECGFNSINPTHIPFSFQFFLVAILFLIFDIEIALVLSYPIEPSSTKNLRVVFFFIMILAIGLIYEWQKGKINWSKWMGKIFFARKLC